MLTEEQIAKFKKILLEKKESVTKKLNSMAKKNENGKWVANFENLARDPEINANEVEEEINKEGVVFVLVDDLKKIDKALSKIENHTYGKCKICNENISLERLEAFPETNTCTNCSKK